MTELKDPYVLFEALVAISKGCTNVTQAKSIAAQALKDYSAGDVRLAVKSGVDKVTGAVFQPVTPGMYTKPGQNLTSYVLDIPYNDECEYRCVYVSYRNGDSTRFILETPKGVDTNVLKNELKDAGLGWYLRNNPEFKYWILDDVAKTKIEADFKPTTPVITIREWNHNKRFRHGYIVVGKHS
ncbi:hypothetical protein D3C85_223740 [compost metagenome]